MSGKQRVKNSKSVFLVQLFHAVEAITKNSYPGFCCLESLTMILATAYLLPDPSQMTKTQHVDVKSWKPYVKVKSRSFTKEYKRKQRFEPLGPGKLPSTEFRGFS